jgi:uncharacterized protein (DUF2225 family)
MATQQKPFFMSTVECPICRNVNEHENLKVGAYTESGKDTDFCPTGRNWTDSAYQNYNPLLFNFATCPKCYYSRELNSSFKEWQQDANFKNYKLPMLRKKHLEELSKENSPVKILGVNLLPGNYPFESAVIKLLLTIYDEKLSDKPLSLDIARYYLRVAWLFREQGPGQITSVNDLNLDRVQKEIALFRSQATALTDKLPSITKIIDSILVGDQAGKRAGVESIMKRLNESCLAVDENSRNIQAVIEEIKKEIPGSPAGTPSGKFGSYDSFPVFLRTVKAFWDEIPMNEAEALQKSLENYLNAYQNTREIRKGLQQLQAAYLIAELSRRLGELERAREYFKITFREAHELIKNQRNDAGTIANTRKILDMATEQLRLSRSNVEASL